MCKMKKVISVIAIILVAINSYSQTEKNDKKIEFGLKLGLNRTNIKIDNIQPSWAPTKNDKFGFDLGLLINIDEKFFHQNYTSILNDHISILFILIEYLNIKIDYNFIYIIFLIKIFCIFSIFYLKINNTVKFSFLFFLLLNPFMWNVIAFSNNLDFLFLPINVLLLNLILTKNTRLFSWICLIGFLIKDTFAIYIIFYIILFYLDTKNTKLLLIFTINIFFLIIFFIKNFYIHPEIMNDDYINLGSQNLFKDLLTLFLTLLILTPLIFSRNNFILLFPILIILLISNNINHLSFYSHYNTFFLVPLVFSFHINFHYFFKKIYFIIFIIISIFFSYSPFSIIFYSKMINTYNAGDNISFDSKKYITAENFIYNLNVNDKIISIQNNFLLKNTLNSKYLIPYPLGFKIPATFLNFNNGIKKNEIYADYLILNKQKKLYLIDQECTNSIDLCNIEYYKDLITSSNNENYNLIYNDEEILIYEKE